MYKAAVTAVCLQTTTTAAATTAATCTTIAAFLLLLQLLLLLAACVSCHEGTVSHSAYTITRQSGSQVVSISSGGSVATSRIANRCSRVARQVLRQDMRCLSVSAAAADAAVTAVWMSEPPSW